MRHGRPLLALLIISTLVSLPMGVAGQPHGTTDGEPQTATIPQPIWTWAIPPTSAPVLRRLCTHSPTSARPASAATYQ